MNTRRKVQERKGRDLCRITCVNLRREGSYGILALVSFKLSSPWHVCPNTCFSRTTCSLSRYKVKIELDYFNCKTGVFLRLFNSMFTKQNNYNPRFCKKINSSMGNTQQQEARRSIIGHRAKGGKSGLS